MDVLFFKKYQGVAFFLLVAQVGFSQVVINEVVTDPQQNWSSTGFTSVPGGVGGSDDEWIELYMVTGGVDLTGWTIELNDGTDVSGDLTSSGAFDVSNYISYRGGTFTKTKSGDYLVLGNVDGSGAMNNSITIILRDDLGVLVDQVTLGGGPSNAPSGTASAVYDEVICRLNNAKDTDIDEDDFYQTIASIGATNSPEGTIVINEIVTDPQTDWSTNSFDGTDGGGTVSDGVDEFIELYIATAGMNLTGYTIDLIDGTDVNGSIESGGAFQVVNYFSSGSGQSYLTEAGDYLVLGNVISSELMNNDVLIYLKDASGTIVDSVHLGNDAPSGDASCVRVESIARFPNGQDTNTENDFVKTTATLGQENILVGNVGANMPGSGYALEFDGTDDYVDMGDLGLTSGTICMWLNSTNSSVATLLFGQGSGSAVTHSGSVSFSEGIGNANDIFVWSNSSTWLKLVEHTSAWSNEWHHLAIVYSGGNATAYWDGVEQLTVTVNFDFDGVNFRLADDRVSPAGSTFSGKIDELSIWDAALTEAEIQEVMCSKIQPENGNYCSLHSYYRFDADTGSTTLIDCIGGNNGTLTNMDSLTDWVVSGAYVGDESICSSGVSVSDELSLAHFNGDQIKATVTSGTSALMCIYRVDEAPMIGDPPVGLQNLSGTDYFGVKLFGSVGGVYTVEYDYTGHPGIVDEEQLRFVSREGNSDAWTEATTITLDTLVNSITLTGQTGTEFILGSVASNPLPIELLSFKATVIDNAVQLDWTTAIEVNNDYFSLERSVNTTDWEWLQDIAGAGNSFQKIHYSTIDMDTEEGVVYYRLKQTDFDGTFTYSDVLPVMISGSNDEWVFAYPNPTANSLKILVSDSNYLSGELSLKTIAGQEMMGTVEQYFLSDTELELDLSSLPKGIYYLNNDSRLHVKIFKD